MIIIDTREKKPLWDPLKFIVIFKKLDEGDYTNEELFNKAHAERKSGIDLYGSLIQNHKRFSAEIQRAIEKDLSFAIFVECTREDFVRKKFHGGYRLKAPVKTLRKIVNTFTERYPIMVFWCTGRDDLRLKMLNWFDQEETRLKLKNA